MNKSSQVPREQGLDNSLNLLKEGYLYIPNRCRRFQSDIFETRLMGQKAICISGEEAARVFYDTDLFQRQGATPKRVQKTLFGQNGIQSMDGEAHKHRKKLFMSLMTKQRLKVLTDITVEQWQASALEWEKKEDVILIDEARKIMCRVACKWAGVPLKESEVEQRASDLGDMIDAFGAIGPRHQRGRRARLRSEAWTRQIIREIRSGKLKPSAETAAHAMAFHLDLNGKRLDTQIAAVELLNILRPIVAIARFIAFGAVAIHQHPEMRSKVASNQGNYRQMFVQEIRRFYPFGPFTGAKVKKDFTWRQHPFNKGTLVLLDIYGTNHHPNIWERPEEFRPERFQGWEGSPFNFIPQGGGEYDMGHRCAGEWVTIDIMNSSLAFMTKYIDYEVPAQDLSINMARMPAMPKSGFVLSNVRLNTTNS
ncbi:cytochrome P450 [Sediminibacillus albus]|uniref:Fatty-acid peroxygenase n=1 Tax=Sediminibacillus albus TaxID=407036 RepID=A0A1G8WVZ5_9BACI|nr:cytochrome P450 [Sediminibacillus albus]SDJ82572.1 fatty-acid peroxygenase [Sediminibacillus albus]